MAVTRPDVQHPLVLTLPVEAESVRTGRHAALEYAALNDVEELDGVASAVGEALNNVVMHAHRGPGAGTPSMELRGGVGARVVTFSVTDDGSGFRPRRDSPGVGLGLLLMRARCDFAIDEAPGGGTVVRLAFPRGLAPGPDGPPS